MPFFQKKNKSSVVFIGLILFQLILISIQVPQGEEPSYFKKAIFFVFSPIQKGTSSFFRFFENMWHRYVYLRHVQTQNQKMRAELFILRQENRLLENLFRKLQEKQAVEKFLASIHHSFLLANVTGVDATNVYKSIVINKGKRHGVEKDMVVVDKLGNLVGRVVGPISVDEAAVQLITDDRSGVSVYSTNKKAIGVLTGEKGGRCQLKYILATNEDIREGEELLTSGFDKIFPSGIKVGKVMAITAESSLFKKILVMPNFNFSELNLVAVIIKKMENILSEDFR
ncbi:MAG: rod shape-determining protein MreC [Candidatus Aminicenantales bacterium]